MKKTLLFSAAFLLGAGMYAQTLDMTPDRFDFSKQEVGQYPISFFCNGVNTAIGYGQENNAADNGLLAFCVGPAGTIANEETPSTEITKSMQANTNIIDLGGTAGKVLCVKGYNCTNENYGPAATPCSATGWWGNLSFLSKYSGATGSGIPVRVRLVFNVINEGYPDEAYDGVIKLEMSASSNNAIPVDKGNGYQAEFAPVNFYTDEDAGTNNGTKWRVLEYDVTVNEATGFPFRTKFTLQLNYFRNACVLIKELSYTMNPEGEPKSEWATYSLTSSVDEILNGEEATFTVAGNQVSFAVAGVVYNISGMQVADAAAGETVTLDRGIYVVKAGDKTEKMIVK